MAINLSPQELEVASKQTTNEPGGVFVPDPVDIANGDATGDDVEITPPSGLQQDIDAANQSIIDTDARIAELTLDISLQQKHVDHYHNIIRGYEDEIEYINGVKETSPWLPSEISEANNIFNDVATRYFPSGHQTTPLKINSFPEELGGGATSTNPSNLIALWPTVKPLLDTFRSTWTNTERMSNTTDDPGDQPDFDDDLQAIHDQCDIVEAYLTSMIAFYTTPHFDDETAGAEAASEAYKASLENSLSILEDFNALTYYVDSPQTEIDAFLTEEPLVVPAANARISEINTTYKKSIFYDVRKEFAIELADFGEGSIYKKLQEEAGRQTQVDRRDRLVRKLATYQAAGL